MGRAGRAGIAALALVGACPVRAADLIENSRFERAYGPAGQPEPAAFGRHVDDEARRPAGRPRDEAILLRIGDLAALSVARPDGDPRGIAYTSAPARVDGGASYLLVLGWMPGLGAGEAALVIRDGAGRILADESHRIVMLADGRAFRAPLVPGPAEGPYLFPLPRGRVEELETGGEGGVRTVWLRIDPLSAAARFAEIALGHGPESGRAAFVRASLLELARGLVLPRGPGLGAAVASAPEGVLLDPVHPPIAAPSAEDLLLEAAPGETVAAELLLARSSGPVELRASDLVRADEARASDDPASGARIEPARLTLHRRFSPRDATVDAVFPGSDRRREPGALRLEVAVPDGTPAGTYRGVIALVPQGGSAGELVLRLVVRDAGVTGNLVPNPSFELARGGVPLGWRVSGGTPGRDPADPLGGRTGRRSLALVHAPLEAVFGEAESEPVPVRFAARHRLTAALRVAGEVGRAVLELEGSGVIELEPVGQGRDATLAVARVAGLTDVELRDAGDGWLGLEAVADLSGRETVAVRIRSDPAPGLGASELHLDDLALVALPEGFERAPRFVSRIANGGFERIRDGEPSEPENWQVAAEQADWGQRAVPRADLVVEAPAAAGRRALLVEGGDGGPGPGLEVRSIAFAVVRGERIEIAFRARPAGPSAGLLATLRAFDRAGRALPAPPRLQLEVRDGELVATPELGRVSLGPADGRGFHDVRLRVLDLPEAAATACLAFAAPSDAAGGTAGFFTVDEARVAALGSLWTATRVDLDGWARWYGVRLWERDTDEQFLPLFERLAGLGVKPDCAAPESFADFRRPFPSVAPPLLAAETAARHAGWARWWWRRGFPAGLLAPDGEDLPRALEAFYAAWLPPLEARGLGGLLWAHAPSTARCIASPRDFKLEGWGRALAAAAPAVVRVGAPCPDLDGRERTPLVGTLTGWTLAASDLAAELAGPSSYLERRERGELLWVDLRGTLARLDAAPARPRAALWQAWLLGFDGWAGEGLARWSDLPGAGAGIDGSYSGDPRPRAAPGVLLWPGPARAVHPSQRLLEISAGTRDVRLLTALEEAVAEGETWAREAGQEPAAELTAAVDAARAALLTARAAAAQPPQEAVPADLDAARGRALLVLERLQPLLLAERRKALARALTPPSRR